MALNSNKVDRIAESLIKSIEAYGNAKISTINMQNQMMMDDLTKKRELQHMESKMKLESEAPYRFDPMKRAQMSQLARQDPDFAKEFEQYGIKTPAPQKQPMQSEQIGRAVMGLSPIDNARNAIYNKALGGSSLSRDEAKMIDKRINHYNKLQKSKEERELLRAIRVAYKNGDAVTHAELMNKWKVVYGKSRNN